MGFDTSSAEIADGCFSFSDVLVKFGLTSKGFICTKHIKGEKNFCRSTISNLADYDGSFVVNPSGVNPNSFMECG